MSDIIVRAAVDRLEVINAPERGEITLELLVRSIKGFYLDHDEIVIGYPAEEAVRYRIVGFDLSALMFHVEKVGGRRLSHDRN